jgi:hypothetical protein
MGLLTAGQDDPGLEVLKTDDTEVALYLDGTERTYLVSELAKQAIKGIQGYRD